MGGPVCMLMGEGPGCVCVRAALVEAWGRAGMRARPPRDAAPPLCPPCPGPQETLRTSQFPTTHIKEKWDNDLYLIGIAYGKTVS